MNLVCGSMWGYRWDEIRVWANSLYRANPDARKILFVRGNNPQVEEKLQALGIEVIYAPARTSLLHTITTRWEPILDHLATNRYDWIVVTDVKDCIYQADPFPWLEAQTAPIVLATESIPSAAPGQDNFNWMKDYLGHRPVELAWMADKEVVCGGTITGWDGDDRPLKRLLMRLYGILRDHPNPRLIDQCVLNHLAHTEFKELVSIPRLRAGFIASGNFCWDSPMDAAPVWSDGVLRPYPKAAPFALYHLYFPRHKRQIWQRYWNRTWDGSCNRCQAVNWGGNGFYGPICLNCGNRYSPARLPTTF